MDEITNERSVAFQFEVFFVNNQNTNKQRLECYLTFCDKNFGDCGSKTQDDCPDEASDEIFGYSAFV